MNVTGVNDAGRVTEDPDLDTGFGIFNQILPIERLSEMLVPQFLPRQGDCVNCG
jgi:hypothetical protein